MTSTTASLAAKIPVRKLKVDFSKTPKYWNADNPYLTHLVHAMSMVFPEGERMFVRAVKHFQSQIKDQELRRQIASFIGQEMLHGNTHLELNAWVARERSGARRMMDQFDRQIKAGSAFILKRWPLTSLAQTVAAEHLTATLAASLLEHPKLLAKMHASVRILMIWHAIEEIEHKAVAFDIYKAVGGGYLRRVTALAITSVLLPCDFGRLLFGLLREDRQLMNLPALAEFLGDLFAPGGLLPRMMASYAAAYHPNFHPNQIDDLAAIRAWQHVLDEYMRASA